MAPGSVRSAGTNGLRVIVTSLAFCGVLGAGVPLHAHTAGEDSTRVTPSALRTRIYFGMWSTHVRDLGRGLSDNALIAFAYRGIYAGTFINSFGDRALTAGVQRNLTPARNGSLTTALGYRAGLITGYDERFFGIGDKLPAIPFVQILGTVDVRNLGIEVAYAGIVASISVSWRL